MSRIYQSVSLMQAAEASPLLAQLARLAQESSARLRMLKPLIPSALHTAIAAGPIDGTTWCLLVNSAASASKLRQLIPALQDALRARGCEVTAIRVKVQPTAFRTAPVVPAGADAPCVKNTKKMVRLSDSPSAVKPA